MKKRNIKRDGLVEKVRKVIKFLVAEDIRTNGKVSSAIIAAMYFLGILLIVIICIWFKLG